MLRFILISDYFLDESIFGLKTILSNIGLDEPFEAIMPLIGVFCSDIGCFSGYLYETISDPHFWGNVAGGLLFEAGMIATCTGVGLPIGLALMGAGTICTAYGSGLFGITDTGNFYSNVTNEHLVDFAFSMGLNIAGGGFSASAQKKRLKYRRRQIGSNFHI